MIISMLFSFGILVNERAPAATEFHWGVLHRYGDFTVDDYISAENASRIRQSLCTAATLRMEEALFLEYHDHGGAAFARLARRTRVAPPGEKSPNWCQGGESFTKTRNRSSGLIQRVLRVHQSEIVVSDRKTSLTPNAVAGTFGPEENLELQMEVGAENLRVSHEVLGLPLLKITAISPRVREAAESRNVVGPWFLNLRGPGEDLKIGLREPRLLRVFLNLESPFRSLGRGPNPRPERLQTCDVMLTRVLNAWPFRWPHQIAGVEDWQEVAPMNSYRQSLLEHYRGR